MHLMVCMILQYLILKKNVSILILYTPLDILTLNFDLSFKIDSINFIK
jgi:hypothetical protein